MANGQNHSPPSFLFFAVRVREREREKASVCVCECVRSLANPRLSSLSLWSYFDVGGREAMGVLHTSNSFRGVRIFWSIGPFPDSTLFLLFYVLRVQINVCALVRSQIRLRRSHVSTWEKLAWWLFCVTLDHVKNKQHVFVLAVSWQKWFKHKAKPVWLAMLFQKIVVALGVNVK